MRPPATWRRPRRSPDRPRPGGRGVERVAACKLLAYKYLRAPSGVRERFDLTRRFLTRKEFEFEAPYRTIASRRDELSHDGSESPQANQVRNN